MKENAKTTKFYNLKLAAIDIGSNGARILISRVLRENSERTIHQDEISFKDIEYVRFPLRLGMDVFYQNQISEQKQTQLVKLMKAFRLLMDLHEVDDHMALATSAFREARNGDEITALIKKETDIHIEVISGSREAEILSLVIVKQLDENTNYLHIDVGGGSTEINLYCGKEKMISQSFSLGSIRNSGDDASQEKRKEIKKWIKKQVGVFFDHQKIQAIGTGGNINKVHSLINTSGRVVQADDIKTLQHYLSNFSLEEKINILKLNPDRADTILPASNIYLSAMKWAGAEEILVPKVGLKDGMMEVLFQRNLNLAYSEQKN